MDLRGKKVVVLGAGRSGRAAATLALSKGAEVAVYDANPNANYASWPAEIYGHAAATHEQGRSVISDLLVVSPGIDTYGSFVSSFNENAGEMIGEIELAYRYYGGTVIGITGTNGKTTTTALIEHLIQGAGESCIACGNYGTPLAEVVMAEEHPSFVALELSSFQLETVCQFKADIAIWLNFSADHMDRYQSLDDYFRAKRNIFINQTSEDLAIVRSGENLGCLAAQTLNFSSEGNDSEYSLDGSDVMFQGQVVADMKQTKLRGTHNAENVMVALAVFKRLGLSASNLADSLQSFTPPAHRCELVATVEGVEYVNDSKATNLHALDSALKALSGPIILLAGGKDKGLNYNEVIPSLEQNVQEAIVYGEIAEQLESCFSQAVPTQKCETLDAAVTIAQDLATDGSTVLLSPGTSSFDQFPSYEARGDYFKKLVNELTN